MNPNNPSSPANFELPAPAVGDPGADPEFAARPETAPQGPQTMPAPQQPAPAMPQAQTLQSPTQAVQQPQAPQPAAAPTIADDADLIEKEWVEKAKSIVAATQSDPRAQSRELNKFKADYLQKRYNKVIKVDES